MRRRHVRNGKAAKRNRQTRAQRRMNQNEVILRRLFAMMDLTY